MQPGSMRTVRRHPVYEHVITRETESFLWRCDDYPWGKNVWNVHPEYEIHLVRNASGVALIGDHIGQFEPGHLAVVGGGLPHDWVTAVTPGEVIRDRDIVLQFDADRVRSASAHLPELAEIEPFLNRALRGLSYHGRTRQVGARLMEDIGRAKGLERLSIYFKLLQTLVASDEFDMLSSDVFLPNLDPDTLNKIQLALSYIQRNFKNDIKLGDVAGLLAMSDSAFSRFFKKNSGNSFVDHVSKLRIGHACKLLSSTDEPVTEICFQTGYSNMSNFNKIFRMHRGTTPSAYRRLARQRTA